MNTIWFRLYLGVRPPDSPPISDPPNTPYPLSAYVVNRKLCTMRLAKADTPAMPHTPKGKEKEVILVQNASAAITETDTANFHCTCEKEEDPGCQGHRGFDVVLHVPHFQTLQCEDGDQAADDSEYNADDHQGPDGLEQSWKSKQQHSEHFSTRGQ